MFFLIKSAIRLSVTIIVTLIVLICIKQSSDFKDVFYRIVYENNFSFAKVNTLYQSYFGASFPFLRLIDAKPVFQEKLIYIKEEEYLDGVKLFVGNEYLVPVLTSGLVVFIGEKEGYGNVVAVEQVDGITLWYGNLDNINVKLYEYIDQGTLLGNVREYLYLVYKKDGKKLNYEEYL